MHTKLSNLLLGTIGIILCVIVLNIITSVLNPSSLSRVLSNKIEAKDTTMMKTIHMLRNDYKVRICFEQREYDLDNPKEIRYVKGHKMPLIETFSIHLNYFPTIRNVLNELCRQNNVYTWKTYKNNVIVVYPKNTSLLTWTIESVPVPMKSTLGEITGSPLMKEFLNHKIGVDWIIAGGPPGGEEKGMAAPVVVNDNHLTAMDALNQVVYSAGDDFYWTFQATKGKEYTGKALAFNWDWEKHKPDKPFEFTLSDYSIMRNEKAK